MNLSFLLSFSTTFFLIPLIIKWTPKLGWVDTPNERKRHEGAIPNLGGVAIFAGVLISGLLFNNLELLLGSSLLFLLGLIDDKYDISAKPKFFVQFIVAYLVVGIKGVYFHPSSFGLINSFWLDFIFKGMSIVFLVGVINAINLLDGIDGLVGGVCAISFLIFTVLFAFNGAFVNASICSSLFACLIAYLYYNYNPASIFLGDNGSLVLGLFLAYFSIELFNVSETGSASQVVVIALLVLPCYDMARLFVTRVLNGVSPFKADNNHVHHLLVKTGMNTKQTVLLLWFVNLSLVLLSVLFFYTTTVFWFAVIKLGLVSAYLYEFFVVKKAKRFWEKSVRIKQKMLKDSQTNQYALKQIKNYEKV